jgi:Cas10/Cmr2, second palm domain
MARALGAPPTDTVRRYVHEGSGRLPVGAKLLAWDANSIHSFVFDSLNATGIRGASEILRDIDRDITRGEVLGIDPAQVLFSGGGNGVGIVAADQVDSAVDRLHELFARRTLVATCTAAAVELDSGRGFGELVASAAAELARNRIRVGPDPEPDVPFFATRCVVCGRRAAAHIRPRGPERRLRAECAPCDLRIRTGKAKTYFEKEPSDFETIADRAGFVGVVYVDGNGVGKTIRGLRSPLAYAEFSRALALLVRDSFRKVARSYGLAAGGPGPQDEGEPEGGFQLPIRGGDDLVAILPGDVSLPMTRDLLSTLEREAESNPALSGSQLGASAGIALARARFPIRNLLEEAEDLLKIAKRRVYSPGSVRSALAFAVVHDGTPRAESVEPERWSKEPGQLHYSGVPYSLPEFEEVSRRRRLLREANIGRSQLFALRRAAEAGPAQLRSHVLYQIGRLPEWQALVRSFTADNGDPLANAERCFDLVVPRDSAGRRILDIADLITVMPHWREVGEEVNR